MRAIFAVLALSAAAIGACSTRDTGSAPPPTLAEKCARSCKGPSSSDHPCVGTPNPDPTCAATCEATLTGKSDDCTACWFGYSGFVGTVCDCSTVPGIGLDLSCEECSYRSSSRSCSTQLIDKCTSNSKQCQGYKAITIDDPLCASKCGAVPNDLLNRCQNYCVPPRDTEHPCHQAPQADIDQCVQACMTRLPGKSDACQSCYFTYSAWLGQTCSCGSSTCEECNLYANAAATTKSCIDIPANPPCNETPQCRGFQDQGIDVPACADLCGVPPREDAGVDAGVDAPADAPDDGG